MFIGSKEIILKGQGTEDILSECLKDDKLISMLAISHILNMLFEQEKQGKIKRVEMDGKIFWFEGS